MGRHERPRPRTCAPGDQQLASSPSWGKSMFVVAFAFALGTSEPGPGFLICSSQDSSSGRTIVYVGEPIHGSDSDIPEFKRAFVNEVEKSHGIHLPYSGCATADTRKQAKEGFDYATEYPTRHNASVVIVKWSSDRGQDWSSSANEPSGERQQAEAASTWFRRLGRGSRVGQFFTPAEDDQCRGGCEVRGR